MAGVAKAHPGVDAATLRVRAEIGSRLKRRRTELGLTLEQVGMRVGKTETSVSNWENPNRKKGHLPQLHLMPAICAALRTTPNTLIPHEPMLESASGALLEALGEKLATELARLPREAHEALWAVVGRFK